MKQLFIPVMISSFALLSACNNDASTAKDETAPRDSMIANSSVMSTDSSSMSSMEHGGGSTMTKKGIALTSAQEVPANTSGASGSADVAYNKESHMLTYTVNWTALTGAPVMAHIHGTAAKGVNAGVKQDLSKLLSKSVAGSFTDSVKIDGGSIKEDSLLAGFYYFNIHTPAHPGGEIRGQIEF